MCVCMCVRACVCVCVLVLLRWVPGEGQIGCLMLFISYNVFPVVDLIYFHCIRFVLTQLSRGAEKYPLLLLLYGLTVLFLLIVTLAP